MSEAAARLTARSKGADGAHSRLASRGRSAGPRPCLHPSRLPCPDSTFFWQLRLIHCTLSKDGGQGLGDPGGGLGQRLGVSPARQRCVLVGIGRRGENFARALWALYQV